MIHVNIEYHIQRAKKKNFGISRFLLLLIKLFPRLIWYKIQSETVYFHYNFVIVFYTILIHTRHI